MNSRGLGDPKRAASPWRSQSRNPKIHLPYQTRVEVDDQPGGEGRVRMAIFDDVGSARALDRLPGVADLGQHLHDRGFQKPLLRAGAVPIACGIGGGPGKVWSKDRARFLF
jgi:hypothetical protein